MSSTPLIFSIRNHGLLLVTFKAAAGPLKRKIGSPGGLPQFSACPVADARYAPAGAAFPG